ncbi:hypothetical protein HDU79_009385 [Rhizoclosmatium sp. JEL0117]|nr:hypothetical protein HDU79_009385 [Rhizoclosmatium sp. JEL0117]
MDTSVIDHFRSLSAVSHTTPIDTLVLNRFYSIFAVVRDDNVRGKSRKGDYMLTMVLLDPTAKVPLGVSMFAKTIERVPEELKAGTVIKLSNLKIQEFNGKLQGLSTFQTTIKQYYFTGSTMDQEGDPDFTLAKHLHSWYTARLSGNIQSDATLMTKGRRNVWTISQLKSARDCFDLYCQVMCVQQQDGLGGMVLLVSDFTTAAFSNGVSMRDESLLYSVAKDCLRVTIWDDNMDVENMLKTNEGGPTLAQIERGTYLFLRNLFSKDARDADGTATIEASLHSERGEKSMGGRWQILDRDHIEVKKIRR